MRTQGHYVAVIRKLACALDGYVTVDVVVQRRSVLPEEWTLDKVSPGKDIGPDVPSAKLILC